MDLDALIDRSESGEVMIPRRDAIALMRIARQARAAHNLGLLARSELRGLVEALREAFDP